MTVEIKGLKEFANVIRKAPVYSVKQLDEAIRKSAVTGTRKIKETTPVKTGTLKRGIRPQFRPLRAIIATHNAPYGYWVHQGAGGRRPNPFMTRGIKASEADINRYFTQALNNIVKYLAK